MDFHPFTYILLENPCDKLIIFVSIIISEVLKRDIKIN